MFVGSNESQSCCSIWSNKLLVAAALASPVMVGWSGTVTRKMSRLFLKRGKSLEFSFLRFIGRRLKMCAPWTARDLSLASLICAGTELGIFLGIAYLPLLSLHCQLIWYPSIKP